MENKNLFKKLKVSEYQTHIRIGDIVEYNNNRYEVKSLYYIDIIDKYVAIINNLETSVTRNIEIGRLKLNITQSMIQRKHKINE